MYMSHMKGMSRGSVCSAQYFTCTSRLKDVHARSGSQILLLVGTISNSLVKEGMVVFSV